MTINGKNYRNTRHHSYCYHAWKSLNLTVAISTPWKYTCLCKSEKSPKSPWIYLGYWKFLPDLESLLTDVAGVCSSFISPYLLSFSVFFQSL